MIIDLAAITAANAERRRIKDAATAGLWIDDNGYRVLDSNRECLFEMKHFEASIGEDSTFCALARNDPVEDAIDALVAEVRRLQTTVSAERDRCCAVLWNGWIDLDDFVPDMIDEIRKGR